MLRGKHLNPNEKFHCWFKHGMKGKDHYRVKGTPAEMKDQLSHLFQEHPFGFWSRLSTLEDVNADGTCETHNCFLNSPQVDVKFFD